MIINNSYDLAKYVSDLNMYDGYKILSKILDSERIEFAKNEIPFKNKNSFVSGFGFTYSDKPVDWYYKGNYSSITTGPVYIPSFVPWSGYETEIMSIHIMSGNTTPIYLGYTIAADYTYTGIRRNQKNMKNISHLSSTIVPNEIILGSLPEKEEVKTILLYNDKKIYEDTGFAGNKFMKNKPKELFDLLFRNKNLFSPYQVVYTLLGAVTSSAHSGIKIKDNSKIICNFTNQNIELESKVIKK